MSPPLDAGHIQRSFERSAATYVDVAELQRQVESRLLERLDAAAGLNPSRVLDLGAGPGRAGRALMSRYPSASLVALDLSRPMLAHAGHVLRACGDAHRLPLVDDSCDLVFSNLTLQWCQPDVVFDEVRRVLRPGGLFLFTTFGPATLHELRTAWAAADGRAHVNEFIDMHILGDCLLAAGFAHPVMDMEVLKLTYRDVFQLMRELKHLGAHNVASDRHRGLTGKGTLRTMVNAYRGQGTDARISATYEVVYGHALGPGPGQPRRSAGAQVASFPIDNLRGSRAPKR